MTVVLFKRTTALLVSSAMVLGALPARAEETIRCDSSSYSYRYCRVNTDNQVELVHQYSSTNCRQNRSWGYDSRGVWVDHGCSADFRVGRGGSHNNNKALAAVAGIAIIAALAANSNAKSRQSSEEVSSWAVGTFTGYDEFERTDVELTILPGGSVSGRAGNHSFGGSLNGFRLEAGRQIFMLARSGNGFTATDERNSSHRVFFQRSSGGY